jgi:hypothetical protein
MVQTEPGMRLRDLLLKHHEKYLTGAKDPDDRFRDFQNHVIHVQDGYFGGASRVAIQWYGRLMGHLAAERWEDAAYAMGVLSHYFTDPLMPLHTAQSEREALVHRPMEWSVCKSYDRILKRWTEDSLRLVFQLGDGEGWLAEAILKGARFSNRSYRKLVESYDVDLGVANPVAALDEDAIQIFAELFGLAITGLARMVERVADEAERRRGQTLPKVHLCIPAVLAVLQVPEQLWLRRIANSEERKAIEALIGEYRETGKVVQNVPCEVYIKRRVLKVRERETAWNVRRRERQHAQGAKSAEIVIQPAPIEVAASMPQEEQVTQASNDSAVMQATSDVPMTIPFVAKGEEAKETHASPPTVSIASLLDRNAELSLAPSIGPKTATAFAEIKVMTVGEFLDRPALSMSRRLAKSWITTTVIQDWQAQTLLMCQVPGLFSRDVQMLVGVGCRTTEELANADAKLLCQQMDSYAKTSDGRRALRGATVADITSVEKWIKAASMASTARIAA